MITIDDLFKYSIIISMAPARIEILKKSFTYVGLPVPKFHIQPKGGDNYINKTIDCKHSHGKAVQFAKDNNWPFIFIFEDDALPRFDCKQKLEELCKDLPNQQIKIAIVGWHKYNYNIKEFQPNQKFQQLAGRFCGAHSYIVFKDAYDNFINATLDNCLQPQFDSIIGIHSKKYFNQKSYISNINCFIQYNSKTEKLINKRTRWFVGYSTGFGGTNLTPPEGFPKVEEFKDIQIDMQIQTIYAKDIEFKTDNILKNKLDYQFQIINQENFYIDENNSILMQLSKLLLDSFDTIIVVNTIRTKNNQRNDTTLLLKYLGILTPDNIINQKVIIQTDQNNIIRENFYKLMQERKEKSDTALANYILYNHYFAINDAIQSNAKTALILEDDCVLLKDINLCIEILKNIPKEYDLINFSSACSLEKLGQQQSLNTKLEFTNAYKNLINSDNGNKYYAVLSGTVRSGSCYAISLQFAKILSTKIAENLMDSETLIRINQYYTSQFFPTAKMYISKTPLMLQKYYTNANSSKKMYDLMYTDNSVKCDDFIDIKKIYSSTIHIDVDDLLKNAYVINVKTNTARLNFFKKVFSYHQLKLPKVFDACTDNCNGKFVNASDYSHYMVVKQAMDNNLPYVLVFEDDAYPCNNIKEYLANAINDIPYDTEYLQLGWNKIYFNIDKKYNRITGKALGCHAYIVFNKGYKHFLDILGTSKKPADNIQHILTSYIIDKPIFIQYNFTNDAKWKNIGFCTNKLNASAKKFVSDNYSILYLPNKPYMAIGINGFASFSYKFIDTAYNHPFIWCFMDAQTILNLIENGLNYYDFSKVEFDQIFDDINKNIIIAKVDKLGIIYFPHYTTIEDTKRKWFRRLERMNIDLKNGIKPVFVLSLSNLAKYKRSSLGYYENNFEVLKKFGKHSNVLLHTTNSYIDAPIRKAFGNYANIIYSNEKTSNEYCKNWKNNSNLIVRRINSQYDFNKKILNITCLSNTKNYGQRLQSYALQKYIKSTFNQEITLIDFRNGFNPFVEFEKQYMNIIDGNKILNNFPNQFDTILIGGDQVLSNANEAKLYFKDEFVGKFKTCTYAASANGTFSSNSNQLQQKLNLLKRCTLVGLREQTDVDIVRKYNVVNEVECNIDPIFLLTTKEWKEIAKKPDIIQDGEVFDFTYNLGNEYDKIIEDKATGIKNYIIYGNTTKIDNHIFQPDEFIWMVLNCRNFTTNSFHGNMFGIIFNKNITFPDKRKFSVIHYWHGTLRIDSALELIGAKIENGKIINPNEVFENITKQRKLAREWLEKCLSCSGFKYACYSKFSEIHDKSSSGGISAVIASYVINNNGVVYGAAYSDDFRSVKTVRVDNMDDYFKKISKSKYSFCQMPNIDQVRKDLECSIQVLFIGCPCQIKQLKQQLGKDYGNLTTVDLLCNGYSRPEFLERFVDEQEKLEKSRVVHMDMRPRHASKVFLKFENGKEKVVEDYVTKVFVCNKGNYIEDCKTCNMHTSGNSHADLTIGDFWDYGKYKSICNEEFSPTKGSSIVYVNTEKGRILFNLLKPQLEWRYLQ